ncbi:DUF108 domain-containing protein [Candidatus Woesearchaeota archaeon]|nr:DUF108 domain-containing protein [Candidatus Woesearchaeota archaeon]
MKIGIIGCGFIGGEIASFIDENKEFKLIGLNDIDRNKAELLAKNLKSNNAVIMEIGELIEKSDFIVESAKKDIVKVILSNKNIDNHGKKLLIMSTGGLIGNMALLEKIKNCQVILPSGAISGLDAIKSAAGKIISLSLTTTKSAKSLEGAPYISKNNIDLKNINEKKIIFEGKLKEAVEGFPQNINVAATLYLASKFKNIKVKIVADPNTKFNTHEIECTGEFGIIKTTTQNLPSRNPRTSYLAVLSAVNVLKEIKNNIKIGN